MDLEWTEVPIGKKENDEVKLTCVAKNIQDEHKPLFYMKFEKMSRNGQHGYEIGRNGQISAKFHELGGYTFHTFNENNIWRSTLTIASK